MDQNIEHDVTWDNDKVARFWKYYSTSDAIKNNYFSKQLGNIVIAFTQNHINLTGKILDYGCGPGFLMEHLLKSHLSCWGLDSVESNVKIIESKFKDNPYFKGAYFAEKLPVKIDDNEFDVVFLLETIEHLLPDNRQSIFREINRITKIGGKIIVTTPYNEDLDSRKIICPECGCIYHQMQHVSSWTTQSLSDLMATAGYKKVVCTSTTFRQNKITKYLWEVFDKITKKPAINLIYIGEKTSELP